MLEALRFFRTFEIWIYLILGLVGIFYLRKFFLAWQELRGAVFGLERENAQGRLNQAASMLIFILALIVAEFTLTSFILPTMPAAIPLFTPTLNILATPTTTISLPEEAQSDQTALEPPETPLAAAAMSPSEESLCVPGQINISSPQNGTEVRGIVEISGSANTPNFGFYKLEMRRADEQDWLTILAGNQLQPDGLLGTWNTALLAPSIYQLRLVVVDNQGVAATPCMIQISVSSNTETPQP